ncbi:MAG: nucleoside recognition domain-containing protein [Fulvivirga sp.]|jgi:spore maturation protein SpmA|uniref:nucleoside recognition domain-containing protein n=2 Tax=Fulvivirga sp. TaxID=1931237 RepID=UPI0032F04249
MVLNYIWFAFFAIAFVVALIKVIFFGDLEVFTNMVNATFDMSKTAVNLSISLLGGMCLWLGLMKIGEKSGLVNILTKLVGPFFSRLFPEIPKNHRATGSIIMNFSANILGLDNAATPIGLKAMNEMQELNPNKDTASNAQIMFLVLNTSGLSIIPLTILIDRSAQGAANPTDIFLPILLATFCSTIVGLITVSIFQKINLLDRVILSYLLGLTTIIGLLIFYLTTLSQAEMNQFSSFLSNFIIFGMIISFLFLGFRKKIDLFSTFIEGAKEGFSITLKIVPFLIAFLVGIGVFRASGAFDYLIDLLRLIVGLTGINADFVDALPVALMKPLSGGTARSMMLEIIDVHGVDSFVGKLASTLRGATETTFYIVAVYFGSVNIKNVRYAITAGLIADLAGIIAAIVFGYMFFH